MPHIIIEYSNNITEAVKSGKILELAHQTLIETGLVDANNIKSRSYCADDFLVGTQGKNGSFMHVNVQILNTRTVEQKKKISDMMLKNLSNAMKDKVDELTVDLIEMDKETYRKYKKVPDGL